MQEDAHGSMLLTSILSLNNGEYLQVVLSEDIRGEEITSEEIDLKKITASHKEADLVVSDPWVLPPVSKAAERFSFPTSLNSIRFGNTGNPFHCQISDGRT